jgi:hypothetical protein
VGAAYRACCVCPLPVRAVPATCSQQPASTATSPRAYSTAARTEQYSAVAMAVAVAVAVLVLAATAAPRGAQKGACGVRDGQGPDGASHGSWGGHGTQRWKKAARQLECQARGNNRRAASPKGHMGACDLLGHPESPPKPVNKEPFTPPTIEPLRYSQSPARADMLCRRSRPECTAMRCEPRLRPSCKRRA